MSEDYKLQVSMKFGPRQEGMLNIRGDSAEEVRELLGDAAEHLPGATGILLGELTKDDGMVAAAKAITEAFPGTTTVTTGGGPPQPPGNASQMCPHGARQYREDKANPPQWKAWFCRLEKNDPERCRPVYVK